MKLLQILNALITTEEKIIPIVVHNPASLTVAGIILAGEEVAAAFISSLVSANSSTPTPPATPTSTGTSS